MPYKQKHVPEQPNTSAKFESLFWKGWFIDLWNWIRRVSDISPLKTASFSVNEYFVYPVSTGGGAVTAQLPAVQGIKGRSVVFKLRTAGSNLTIVPAGTDTIEGSASYVISVAGDTVQLVADGIDRWYVQSIGGTSGVLASPLTTKGDIWGYSTVDARIPVGATNGHVLTVDSAQALGVKWAAVSTTSPGGADTNIQFNDGGAFGGEADFTWSKTTNTLTLGDASILTSNMTSATANNRFKIQNSVANGNSNLYVVPNGSATTSTYRATNNPDLTAALSFMQVGIVNTVAVLDSNVLNAGTQGTLELRIGGAAALQFDTTKNAQFKAGVQVPVATQATGYTVVETDVVILGSASGGNWSCTLSAANVAGAGFTQVLIIKRTDSSANTFTINRAGADTIDGGTSYLLGALQSVTLVSDGVSAWYSV